MPRRLHARYEYDAARQKMKPLQNKSRKFEKMVMSFFQRIKPDCRIENFSTTGTQRKIDYFNADEFCGHCNRVFEAMGCVYHYCLCQKSWSTLTEDDIQRGTKKEGNERNAETVYRGERLQCFRKVGMWMVETRQHWCVSEGTLERLIPIQASVASGPVIGNNKIRRSSWSHTVWHQSSRKSERKICQFPANAQKYKRV